MWHEDKDYFQFEIGDIVIEDWLSVWWDEEPMVGIVLNIKRHVYFLGSPDHEVCQDKLTVYWFKSKRFEFIPSDFVNLFSR